MPNGARADATPPSTTSDRLFTYDWRCANGHRWTRTMTRAAFVDLEHRCPKCKAIGTKDVSAGMAKVAREMQYPYVNTQLPFKYVRDRNGKVIQTIKPVIENAKQEREYAAGAWNGEKWLINQL
jgi:phage FluMu protein Com